MNKQVEYLTTVISAMKDIYMCCDRIIWGLTLDGGSQGMSHVVGDGY